MEVLGVHKVYYVLKQKNLNNQIKHSYVKND